MLKPTGSVLINISPHKRGGQLSDYVLRTRLSLRDAGWFELAELVWHKPNAMPTGARNRPRRSWESVHWFGVSPRAYGNPQANGKPNTYPTRVNKSGQHIKHGWKHYEGGSGVTPVVSRCTDVLTQSTSKEQTGHPAPFPVGLAAWLARLACPPGGVVLDPFSGSASTGVACLNNGMHYIGIDAVGAYNERAERRLQDTYDAVTEPLSLPS